MSYRVCPVCRSKQYKEVLLIEGVPAQCNVLWSTPQDAINAARADIVLVKCQRCSMVWNRAFDDYSIAYADNYENALHFSPSFRSYLEQTVRHLALRFDIVGKDVIEIGCGDGSFLAMLSEISSNRVLGFDPGARTSDEPGTARIEKALYSPDLVDKPVDLIVGRHLLEHLPDPRTFLDLVKPSLAGGGIVYFEVPDFRYVTSGSSIWDVLYEHCLYFTPEPLAHLFNTMGFEVVELRSTFAGEFLSIVARLVHGGSASINGTESTTFELALMDNLVWSREQEISRWAMRLEQLEKEGRRIVVWGAGSRGVMFLNSVPGASALELVVDINPRKRGAYVSGTGHRIRAPGDIPSDWPDVVLIMNPIYAEEIEEEVKRMGWRAELLVV